MRLHRNAALSWIGRRQLAERVVVQGWSVTAAAEAAGVSVRCARKWVGRYKAAGEAGLVDRSSAPATVANRTDPERIAVIAKLRTLRMTAAEIAETLGMPLSTVSGILTRIGMGRLGRLGLEPAVRYERARPGELVHVDVKKLGRISRRRPACPGRPPTPQPGHHRRRRQAAAHRRVRVRPHRCRRSQPPRLRRSTRRRESDYRRRLPPPRRPLLPPLRHPGRGGHQRQRRRLHLHRTRDRLSSAEDPTPAHPPLPAADKRKGRALHPHDAQRLGLRRHLRLKPRTHRRP